MLFVQGAELLDGGDGFRETVESVEQGNDLAAGETVMLRVVAVREQDLQRGAQPRDLEFPPQPAFFARDTVHDARDVAEMVFELVAQVFRGCVGKKRFFVKRVAASCGGVGDAVDQGFDAGRVLAVAGAELVVAVVAEKGREFGHGADHDGVGEVEVFHAVGVVAEAVDEAVEVLVLIATGGFIRCMFVSVNNDKDT